MGIIDLMTSRVSKYVISGAIASLVMFVSLVFFRETLGIWYLYSSSFAFILAFLTSFALQKLWTFKNNVGNQSTHKQLVLFFVVSIINLGINALGMFILVDLVHIWYIFSQFLVTVLIAVWSFFVYRAIFT